MPATPYVLSSSSWLALAMPGIPDAESPRSDQASQPADGQRIAWRSIVTNAGVALPGPALAIGLHQGHVLGPLSSVVLAVTPSMLKVGIVMVVKLVRFIPEIKREQSISDVVNAAIRVDCPLDSDHAQKIIAALTSNPGDPPRTSR